MESFLISFNVVMPLFLLFGFGRLTGRLGMLKESGTSQLNAICFNFLLPIMLFCNIYDSDFLQDFPLNLILFALGSQAAALLVLLLIVPAVVKQPERCGALIQAMFRTNFIIFGLPIAASVNPEALGVVSVLAAFVIPFYNLAAVLVLELYRGSHPDPLKILASILKNPFLLTTAFAFLLVWLKIPLPDFLLKPLRTLGQMASPLSLMVMGNSFYISDSRNYRQELVLGVSGRLVILPGALLLLSVLCGFGKIEMLALTCMLITPTASATYSMAQQMDSDAALANHLVVYQTLFSILSIFAWVWLLTQFQLI